MMNKNYACFKILEKIRKAKKKELNFLHTETITSNIWYLLTLLYYILYYFLKVKITCARGKGAEQTFLQRRYTNCQ